MSFNIKLKVGDNVVCNTLDDEINISYNHWGVYEGDSYEITTMVVTGKKISIELKGLIPYFNSKYFKLAEEKKEMSDKKFKKGDKVKRIYGSDFGDMKLNGEYVVNAYNGFEIQVESSGSWFKASYFKLVEESPKFIERDGKYNLEVTGEQLAWIFAVAANTASGNKASLDLYQTIQKLNKEQFEDGELTKNIGIHYMSLHNNSDYKEYLTKVFTPPETEQQRKLRELEEQYKALGEKIGSLKEGK